LITEWAFPGAIVDLVSQIDYLTETVAWLSWIDKLPNSVLGLIQGAFPPLDLEILMVLLLAILRAFVKLQENHTGMATEGGYSRNVFLLFCLFRFSSLSVYHPVSPPFSSN